MPEATKPDTILQMWDSYAKGVIPPDAPEIQITECQRAFMAGAWAMINSMANCANTNKEEVAEQQMEIWFAELETFYQNLKNHK